MARHHHPHEFLGGLIGVHPVDEHFLHVPGVEVADRALYQARVLVDQRGSDRAEGSVPNVVPGTAQILEIAPDFRLAALRPGGAHDHAHAVLDFQIFDDLLQFAARVRVGDLAGDTAAARGVGHQHAIAAGERDVGGQRRPLVAPLLLDHLDQDDLVSLDDFLDLVASGPAAGRARFAVALGVAPPASAAAPAGRRRLLFPGRLFALSGFRLRSVFGRFRRFGAGLCRFARVFGFGLRLLRVRLGSILLHRLGSDGVGFGRARGLRYRSFGFVLDRISFIGIRPLGFRNVLHRAVDLVDERLRRRLVPAFGIFRRDQGFPVLDRDLEIVGVDIVEREETVPVAAEVDERRLERRLDPGDLG